MVRVENTSRYNNVWGLRTDYHLGIGGGLTYVFRSHEHAILYDDRMTVLVCG